MESLPPPPLPSNRLVTFRGWVLVILGPALCAAGAYLAYYLWLTIHGHTHSHWHGDQEMTAWAYDIFIALATFGLAALACGICLLLRGRIGLALRLWFILNLLALIWYGYRVVSHGPPA